jgi:adenosylcobalamin-dependent ribonucleoside-triphosphate reductase
MDFLLDKPPMDMLGYFVYQRTYARRLKPNDPNSPVERWEQTIARIVDACNSQLECNFTKGEKRQLFSLLYNLKCSVAGRFMWQLGTRTVEDLGLMSLQNCAFRKIDSIDSFLWCMDCLMLGTGVGVNIQKKHVDRLPKIKPNVIITRKDTYDADFIVPDSREGWVRLLREVLMCFFVTGESLSYSTKLVRKKGTPIKGFGGVASGPNILCEGIDEITNVLTNRTKQHMRPIDALDIVNIIGMIVVAGNVRRSAIIALGDHDDKEYLRAKRWDLGNIPIWRSNSNNTIIVNDINDIMDNDDFWDGYNGNGEPYGLFNLDLTRKCGRTGEIEYADPTVEGTNPCGEISLSNGETCCLAELFLPNIKSIDELVMCAKYLYRICKHSLLLPCHHKVTENIVHRNSRIGIGITGYLQATEEQKKWLPRLYDILREYDELYSYSRGIRTSIKLTTVKPSGTLSLLAGCTPGVHPAYSRYYIRRVRVSSDSPLLELIKKHNYPHEYALNFDGSRDERTMVVSFPTRASENAVLTKDLTAVKQLEYVKRLQAEWSDNAVSVTVYYRKEELPELKEWLKTNYNEHLKSVSFLLHSEHGFLQAPYEEILKEEYDEMMSKVIALDFDMQIQQMDVDESEMIGCTNGSCPIR